MFKSYGINRLTSETSEIDTYLEEFRNLGYTIIENVLNENELILLRDELQKVYSIQETAFGKENLKLINEEYMARAILCYSELFLNLAKRTEMMEYVESILGTYFLLHLQNGIINMPKEEHHQSSWHRDLPYQNYIISEPLACNVFYCLDDFCEETGGTIILPYSHKIPYMPSEKYLNKNSLQVNAKAGSVVLFDSMLFHKAGYNNSNIIRRGINHLYAKAVVRQQIDLPSMLNGKYSDDPFLNILLGYDAQTSTSVENFRTRRLNKNSKKY